MPISKQHVQERLRNERNIWLASVRPGGAPHLVPIWFVADEGKVYVCTDPESVKIRNIRNNPRVVLALEDGSHPVILEGAARLLSRQETPEQVVQAFKTKYDWDICDGEQYTTVIEITQSKVLGW